MQDQVEKEWRRLLGRARRRGLPEVADYLSGVVQARDCPLWYPYRFATLLLEHREFSVALELLDTVKHSGGAHPLIDRLYAKCLWCTGKRREAVRFTERKAKFWSHSCLYNLLSAMHKLNGESKRSQRYLGIAVSLAKRELTEKPRKAVARRREKKEVV